jgi:SAM-dependent methyltransferase
MAGSSSDEVRQAISDVRDLYTSNLAEHGVSSSAVGWPDAEKQVLRFEKLAHLIAVDRPAAPVTVNDWGCGYGAMFSFLDALPGVELARYVGYDVSSEMLEAAREHVPDPRAEWVLGSEVTQEADYSFLSGTFNVRMEASDASWASYVQSVLRLLHSRSRRGFAFNLLTSYVDWRKDDLFYADPAEFFAFCKTELSRFVTLLHDYPLYEWTIVVLKEERPA